MVRNLVMTLEKLGFGSGLGGSQMLKITKRIGKKALFRGGDGLVFEVVKSGWDMCEANADSSHYIKHTGNVEKTSRNNPSGIVFMSKLTIQTNR